MHCNQTRTASCRPSILLKSVALLGVGLILAYVALPNFRLWIAGSAPLLLSMLCPLMMLFCMRHAFGSGHQQPVEARTENAPGGTTSQQDV